MRTTNLNRIVVKSRHRWLCVWIWNRVIREWFETWATTTFATQILHTYLYKPTCKILTQRMFPRCHASKSNKQYRAKSCLILMHQNPKTIYRAKSCLILILASIAAWKIFTAIMYYLHMVPAGLLRDVLCDLVGSTCKIIRVCVCRSVTERFMPAP